VHAALRVDQLHAVPDGDVADRAALAGQQGGDPGRRHPRVQPGAGRLGRGEPAQPGEPLGIARLGHHARQVAVRAGEHPGQAGAQHVAADEHQQARREVLRVVRGGLAAFAQPLKRQPHPARAGVAFGAAGLPALLPSVARKRRKPPQQLGHPAASARPGGLDLSNERWRRQPLQGRLQRLGGVRPPPLDGAGREPRPQQLVPRPRLGVGEGGGQRLARHVLGDHGHSGLRATTRTTRITSSGRVLIRPSSRRTAARTAPRAAAAGPTAGSRTVGGRSSRTRSRTAPGRDGPPCASVARASCKTAGCPGSKGRRRTPGSSAGPTGRSPAAWPATPSDRGVLPAATRGHGDHTACGCAGRTGSSARCTAAAVRARAALGWWCC
jgi:hypothetical protein